MKMTNVTFFLRNNIKLQNKITDKLILILKLPDEMYILQTYLEPMSFDDKKPLSYKIELYHIPLPERMEF